MKQRALREAVAAIAIILVISIALFIIKPAVDYFVFKYLNFLHPYIEYINGGIAAIFVGGGGILILRIIRRSISQYFLGKSNRSLQNLIELLISFFMYTLIIAVILTSLGINLTGALVGGSVGALIIGIALQNIFSNIFSGFAVTSAGAIKPGEIVSMGSWLFGSPITGEIVKVSYLFTDVKNSNGRIIKVPNSAFLGNTIFERLSGESDFSYNVQVTLPSDVPQSAIEKHIREINASQDISWFLSGLNGTTMTFNVTINVEDIKDLNGKINDVNKMFNEAYWRAKKEA
ncbi:hypothetical protein [Thermoplasma volcanium GSS1]|uniref:Mechanosensitive ion channel MscS domain-containing protein n=1 Tax=Thermoplasma volcanium (strain ATCC 51530 / DSM 4299 / JCM 9571 / NBRC 15438 / GSS1) TaxID=273116 RepID=Q97AV5_THEVO|nr:mechanosensitive ion channel family protein [Thermoplasma volcanium]BAB59846.1 hypothetical protein [Thermoplasma volcanium GSS1]